MKTLANLEIGEHFTFYRKSTEYVYLGFLNGAHHYIYLSVGMLRGSEAEETSADERVTPKATRFNNELFNHPQPHRSSLRA